LNFGTRHCQREDDWIARHVLDHLGRDDIAAGKTDEDIGAVKHVAETAFAKLLVGLFGDVGLGPVHPLLAIWIDRAGPVANNDVFDTGSSEKTGHADSGYAGAADNDADVIDLLADHLERIQQSAEHENGGAMMLIRKNRDAGALFKQIGDLERTRR